MNDREILVPSDGEASKAEIKLYQEKVGSLIPLMVSTRPDISYAVIKLARFATNPGLQHQTAIKRVFRYLSATKNLCIHFAVADETRGISLVGYTDADWAGPHSEAAKSPSGYVFMIAGGPVSWTLKKQPCVALSSIESEYISSALAVQEAV